MSLHPRAPPARRRRVGAGVLAGFLLAGLALQLRDGDVARVALRIDGGGSGDDRIGALLGDRAPVLELLRREVPPGGIVVLKRRPEQAWIASHLHQLAYPLRLLDESLAHRIAEVAGVAGETVVFVLDLAPAGPEPWHDALEPIARTGAYALWKLRAR